MNKIPANSIVKALRDKEAEAGNANQWKLEELCKMAALEIETKAARIAELTASNARLQATYDHVEEINLRYAELIQPLQNDRKLADMAWTDNQAALNKQAAALETIANHFVGAYTIPELRTIARAALEG